jgi:RND family efflux transporter MFP subunit
MSSETVVPAGQAGPGRRHLTRIIAVVAVVALLALGAAFKLSTRKAAVTPAVKPASTAEAPASPTAVEVRVEPVAIGALEQPVRVTGTLRTDETVTLSTKATGLVKSVSAKEGDRVSRGQLLVVIDDSDIRAQRDRAVAAVQAAEATVVEKRAQVQSYESKLRQAKTSSTIKDTAARSDYRKAEQALETAKSRMTQAKSQAGIQQTESETRVNSAKENLQAARERLKSLTEGSRKQEIATATAAVTRAETQVARAKSAYDRRAMLLKEKAIAEEAVDNARRDYEVAVADLAAAKENLSLVREGPRGEEIRAQEEQVRSTESLLRDAEANRAKLAISNEDVRAAENGVQQAQAGLEAAKAALAQTNWNVDEVRSAQAALAVAKADVAKARAAVVQARSDVRLQDELIAQTRVFSPVNGIVTKRQVQTGAAVVQMRNELMTLVSSDTLYFEAAAPEAALSQLRPGLPAQVMLDAVPGKIFPGTVREIIPVAEGVNRSVRLRISIPADVQSRAVVGGFARAQVTGRTGGDAMSVPRTALVSDEGEPAVFVLRDGKAVRTSVVLDDPGGGVSKRVRILSGLTPGERVIVEGAADLTDGQAVKVK